MPPERKIKRSRKMTSIDVRRIVAELKRWEAGELGSKLTWSLLEKSFEFTRAAMNSKVEIKQAYTTARSALKKGGATSNAKTRTELEAAKDTNSRLRQRVAELESQLENMQLLWQRIAYHLMTKGVGSISMFDQPIPHGEAVPGIEKSEKLIVSLAGPLQKRNRR